MFHLLNRFISVSVITVLISILSPQLALSEENSEVATPPDTGTPEDTTNPGGTRDDSKRAMGCQYSETPIVSLVGNKTREYTVSEYPSFWFYVPDSTDQKSYFEFVLEDSEAKKVIYRTSMQLSKKAGITEVPIPSKSQHSLKPNKNYSWYVKGYCSLESGNQPDMVLSGWIKRISSSSKLPNQLKVSEPYNFYVENEIIYDAVTIVANAYRIKPDNLEIKNDWGELLNMLGVEHLSNQPFISLPIAY